MDDTSLSFPWWFLPAVLAVVLVELLVAILPVAIPSAITARRRGYPGWTGALAGIALFAAVAIPTAAVLPDHKHLGVFAGWIVAWAVLAVVARRVKVPAPS